MTTPASLRIDHPFLCATSEQWLKFIWASTYGASIALQVQERVEQGYGPPNQKQYLAISEDAAQVADDATQAYLTNVQNRDIR